MAVSHGDAARLPRRVVWVQDLETSRWVLVGLTDDGRIEDPRDYEEVSVSQPCFCNRVFNY